MGNPNLVLAQHLTWISLVKVIVSYIKLASLSVVNNFLDWSREVHWKHCRLFTDRQRLCWPSHLVHVNDSICGRRSRSSVCQLAHPQILDVSKCGWVFMIANILYAHVSFLSHVIVSFLGGLYHKRRERHLREVLSNGRHFSFGWHVRVAKRSLSLLNAWCLLLTIVSKLLVFPNLLERPVRIENWGRFIICSFLCFRGTLCCRCCLLSGSFSLTCLSKINCFNFIVLSVLQYITFQ